MKKLIVMGISHHGNIGDSAISIAQETLLKKCFPNYEIFEIQEKHLDICAHRVKNMINDEDIILLQGGGNIGDIYDKPERGRREVIKLYPNNKIIIFPQTAYFSDTGKGRKELEISKQIYNSHKNLIIMAREEKTYNFMKEHFYNAKVYFTPDVVMSLIKKSNKERKGALLLLRSDKEKVLEDDKIEVIKELVNEKFEEYTLSDTYLAVGMVNVGGNIRDKLLEEKFNQFQTAEITITDRLHGMIFAAITETPCVVFGNFNHKVIESYKWLKNLEYISFCDNIDNIEEHINKVVNAKNRNYDNLFAEEAISKVLKQEIEG